MKSSNTTSDSEEKAYNPQATGQRETQPIIGSRMRELRKAKSMTLHDLALETGLSVGHLSQLEREHATPSIRSLNVIASILGVSINWFFPDPEGLEEPENTVVVRSSRRRSLKFESGIRDELLSPTLSGKLELLLCTLEAGGSSGDELYAHDGEEAGYVDQGQLELTIESEVYLLGEGDSFHFDSSKPHRYKNPGKAKTVVIWVMTPPHY